MSSIVIAKSDSVDKTAVRTNLPSRKAGNDTNVDVPINGQAVNKNTDTEKEFSVSNATTNFFKGLIAPVTNLLSSKKNMAIGAAMVVGSALAIAAVPPLAPILTVAGLIYGGVCAAKFAYKEITAKNNAERENAFYDLGEGTSTVGLSMLGAKSALRTVSIGTKEMGVASASLKCIQIAGSSSVESYQTIKTGLFITNLAKIPEKMFVSRQLMQIAKDIAEGKSAFSEIFDRVKMTVHRSVRESIEGRSKSEISNLDKLTEKVTKIKTKINEIKSNNSLTEEQKGQKIENMLYSRKNGDLRHLPKADKMFLRENGYDITQSENILKSLVGDSYGMRLTLEDTSPESINKIVANWIKEIKSRKMKITEIENYHGDNTKGYFTRAQLNKIKQTMLDTYGDEIRIRDEIKPSGYTGVNLKIQTVEQSGEHLKLDPTVEFQIRGKQMHEAAESEHLLYDLSTGKDISRGNNKIALMTMEVRNAVRNLTPEQADAYENYHYENYSYARKIELGMSATKPVLPEGLDPILSSENLHDLSTQINQMPTGILKKNPFSLRPQLGIASAVNDSNDVK